MSVCDDCIRENFVECSVCEELIPNDSAFLDVNGEYYCESCFEISVTEFNGEMYPNEELGECKECGVVCLLEDMIDGMCPDCYNEEEENE